MPLKTLAFCIVLIAAWRPANACSLATPTDPVDGFVFYGDGGPAAVAMHAGPYDELSTTYAAIERWIKDNGYRAGDAPWESYITDPAEHPDPADWRTRVCWPLEKRAPRSVDQRYRRLHEVYER